MRILKSLIAPKSVKGGDSLGFLKLQFAAKYQKFEGGTLRRQKNFYKIKVSQSRKGAGKVS